MNQLKLEASNILHSYKKEYVKDWQWETVLSWKINEQGLHLLIKFSWKINFLNFV